MLGDLQGDGLIIHHWDADGLCSAALLLDYLKPRSPANMCPTIGAFYLSDEEIGYARGFDYVIIADMALPEADVRRLSEKTKVVIFDQVNHLAIYPDGKRIPVPEGVQDVLSSLYYVRTLNLEVGKSVFIQNHADGKNYPLEVKVLRTETITVPAGTFECFVVEPILKASGIFQHKGRLTVWLSTDPSHIPVMMKSKVIIGSINAILIDLKRE